jgi:hypothetical protein
VGLISRRSEGLKHFNLFYYTLKSGRILKGISWLDSSFFEGDVGGFMK